MFFQKLKSPIIIFIVLLILSIIIPIIIFGTSKYYFIIAGDEMCPDYNRYDKIFVKKTSFNDLKAGDAITFFKQENILVGRISAIDYYKKTFSVTAGNNANLLYGENLAGNLIIGKVAKKSPYLFNLLYGNFLVRLAIICLLTYFINLIFRKRRNRRL